MKRFLTLIAATAALGLAAFAYAGEPEDQAGATQPSPAEQPSMPSTDPTTPYAGQTDPSAAAQSNQLKPDANVKAEVRKAEEQARSDTRSPQG